AFSATVPQLDTGSLLDLRVEVETVSGDTFSTEPRTVQVGLSCEPLVLLSKTGSGQVSAVDTGTLFEVGETHTSRLSSWRSFPLGQTFHAAKNGVYVANFGSDTVTFLRFLDGQSDPSAGAGGVFLPPGHEIALAAGTRPWGLALGPQGEDSLYVTGSGTDQVYRIDTRTDEVVAQAPVGRAPKGMAVTPDGAKLYVADVEGSSLAVLDATSLAPRATIPLDGKPQYVSLTADGSTAVVTLDAQDDVAFIDV